MRESPKSFLSVDRPWLVRSTNHQSMTRHVMLQLRRSASIATLMGTPSGLSRNSVSRRWSSTKHKALTSTRTQQWGGARLQLNPAALIIQQSLMPLLQQGQKRCIHEPMARGCRNAQHPKQCPPADHEMNLQPYEDSAVVMANESTPFAVALVAVAGLHAMTNLRWTREIRVLS